MKQLIEIQSALKAPKNQYNSFGKYNYRSQEDILEALKPLLKQHECTLTITDEVKQVGPFVYVEAKVIIQHGTEVVSVTAQAGISDRKGMDLAQSFGSSSSYARKYALNGLFLIDDTKDPDGTNKHGKDEPEVIPEPVYQHAPTADERLPVIKLVNKLPEKQRPAAVARINGAKTMKELAEMKAKLEAL
jgi:hypothetical protein